MTEWMEVMGIAFGAQLAVLPGEKVQFIIAGLSTRFNPYIIVAAAGSAFAGWTAVEVLLGNALQEVLPKVYLDVVTAGLFLLFGAMLYRSAPQEGAGSDLDGMIDSLEAGQNIEVLGVRLPDSVATFLGIFSMMAVGEVGDKTQLVTISLAVQYDAGSAIWVGEMLAILPVSLANALLFRRFAHTVRLRTAHLVAATVFVFFGLDTIFSVAAGVSVWETGVRIIAEGLLRGNG